ncbi:hypothetical protein [Streptomyces agglomeratus]|uniref:hypothetical protein n=1 Tax=Streptomyces agglomeratus TaxID=285458 RepID=UPI001428B028|nr:hypothetical protein [Streptomyces agglomeratus]
MPIDPYAALNAMVRAEVARSSEPPAAASAGSHEPQQSQAADDAGESRGEDPAVAHRP